MARTPARTGSTPSRLSPGRLSLGPKLIGLGVALFVVTRVIVWLPLGLVGSWINGFLWPVLLLSLIAGVGLTYLKSKRSS